MRNNNSNHHRNNYNFAALSTTTLHMSDFDFPSAMPMKPELTMKEKLQESVSLMRRVVIVLVAHVV